MILETKEFKSSKVIRLFELAKRIGWTEQKILLVLKEAGYLLPTNKPYQYLGSDHIELISKLYVKAVHTFQAEYSNKASSLSEKALFKIRNFLRRFVDFADYEEQAFYLRKEYVLDNEDTKRFYEQFYIGYDPIFILPAPDVLNVKLSDERIKQFFLQLIYEFEISFLKDIKSILRDIQIKIKHIYYDGRRRIFLQILSHHYHSFASDEEHTEEVLFLNRFSVVKNNLREAIINRLIYFKQLITCKTSKHLLLLSI